MADLQREETPQLDEIEINAGILDELQRIRQLQQWRNEGQRSGAAFERSARSFGADPDDDNPILEVLRTAQAALLRHPTAAAFIFRALAREGRAYASTDAGRERAAALAADPQVDNLRRLWEATSLNVLGSDLDDHDGDGHVAGLPEDWVDLMLDAAGSAGFDEVLDAFGEVRL